MKGYFTRIRQFYRATFSRSLGTVSAAFGILLIIGILAGVIWDTLPQKVMDFFSAYLGASGVVSEDGAIDPLILFVNNLRAMLFSIAYGFIPFICLPALTLGTNAMLIGLFGVYYVQNGQSLLLYMAGIIPHGIFEIPALILSLACGLYLCSQVTQYLRRHEKGAVRATIANIIPIFVCQILPLTACAALVESYITPVAMRAFL